jgi:hypothetical protein
MAFTLSRAHADQLQRARDPLTPAADLVGLSLDRDPAVKAAVAGRSDCPLATLCNLAQEADARVLEAAASNPSLPLRILEQLADHKRPTVRAVARQRLGLAAA